jgi:DNA polymerase III delta' subunit
MRSYFSDLFGNDFHKNRIALAVLEERLPHALLIDGPSGSGKMTFATEIAAALNCESKGDVTRPFPCGRCNSCRRVREGSFTDVKILKRTDGKATIGVNQIKDFRADMYLSATESGHKVYIIDEAEKMTTEAQNALLIILEEPPKNVVILLLASGTDSILTTIKSRTQYIPMSRFTTSELSEYLNGTSSEARSLEFRDSEGYKALLVSADGRIGKALELLNPKTREENEQTRGEILAVVRALGKKTPYTELYAAINSLPQKRAEFSASLEILISALGDLVSAKKSENFQPVFFTDTESAKEAAREVQLVRLLKIYEIVIHTYRECEKNANVNLAAANMASKIKMA